MELFFDNDFNRFYVEEFYMDASNKYKNSKFKVSHDKITFTYPRFLHGIDFAKEYEPRVGQVYINFNNYYHEAHIEDMSIISSANKSKLFQLTAFLDNLKDKLK